MTDIKRNSEEPKKVNRITRKKIELDQPQEKKNTIQIHHGNVNNLKLLLLQTSCKNQVMIIKLLSEIKTVLEKK